MWNSMLAFLLGEIGQYIILFIANLKRARANDPRLFTMIENLVTDIETRQVPVGDGTMRLYTGAEKRNHVSSVSLAYAKELGLDIGSALLNSLIELVVQKVKSQPN